MQTIFALLPPTPILSFALLLAVILVVPILFEKMHLPGVVGLLAAGIALGPNGLGFLEKGSETMELLSDIGLIYLMFVAGLEIDIAQFKKTKHRSAGFGWLTFICPFLFGLAIARLFGFGWNASALIGSLFASHTLLAYPIISRLGVVDNEAVTVTIGATIFTDIGALIVLAICIGINAGDFTIFRLLTLLGSLVIYTIVILVGFDRLGREFFRRSGDEEGNQFLFVLLAVFLASLGAELIHVEKIVGAFLAGLAVNEAVGEGPVKEKVVFVGSVLFIPIFFVDLGLLIDLPAFIKSLTSIWLTASIVGGLIMGKFFAAFFAKLLYRYSWREMLTMWSLSLPQVAATLAAALVGYRAKLLTEDVLNSVIMLMLVTSTLGPLMTSRWAVGLPVPNLAGKQESKGAEEQEGRQATTPDDLDPSQKQPFTVVVPVYNPKTEQNLIELAALIAHHRSGRIVPLAIAPGHVHMDALPLAAAIQRGNALLANAQALSADLGIEAQPLLRIDNSIAEGISRASREQNSGLIVMGWGNITSIRARLFGSVIDGVLWSAHCPVAVTRLLEPPSKIQRILVPIENLAMRSMQVVQFAQIFANANQSQITLLHVCDRHMPANIVADLKSQLVALVSRWIPDLATSEQLKIQILPHPDLVEAVVHLSQEHDLVVLRSLRRRTSAGGLAISDVSTRLIKRLTRSFVMLGEPHHYSYEDELPK